MKTTEKNGTKKREFSATLLNELLGSCEDPRNLLKGDKARKIKSGNPVLRRGAGGQGMRWKAPAGPH